MSKCLKRETMQAFADGELHESAQIPRSFISHSCASCAAELENIRATNLQTQQPARFTRSRSNSRTGARRSNSIHSRIRRKPQTNDRRNNRGNRSVRAARLHASAAQRAARKLKVADSDFREFLDSGECCKRQPAGRLTRAAARNLKISFGTNADSFVPRRAQTADTPSKFRCTRIHSAR